MTSFIRISQKLVFHQSKCICAIKRILSTTAMYVSSSSFMYLRFPYYCDACLNSSDLRVGVTTLLNTILQPKIAQQDNISWLRSYMTMQRKSTLTKRITLSTKHIGVGNARN